MKTTFADQIRLGSDVAAIKKQLPRKKWKTLVKTAHKQGFTVSGALSDAPNSLKERTKSSLVKEATKTVSTAYKPQEQEASRQQVRLDALASKRRADDAFYREWMTNQTDSLTAKARAADVALNGLSQTTAAASRQGLQDMKSDVLARAQTLAGGSTSDPNQSTALTKDVAAAGQSSTDQVGHAAEKGITTGAGNVNTQDFLKAAVLANASGNRAKVESTISGDQEKLNAAVASLKTAKTGDLQKAISDLLSNEATKASSNRDYAAAAAQLGLKTKQLNLDALKEKHDYGIKTKQINLAQYKATNAKAYNDAKIRVDYDKIASAEGKAAADRALKKWIAAHPKKGAPSAADAKTSRTNYQTVETVRQQIRGLYKQYPNGKTKSGKDFRQVLLGRGYDNVTLDLAFDLNKNKGKLSPGTVKMAKTMLVGRYYPTLPGPPTP